MEVPGERISGMKPAGQFSRQATPKESQEDCCTRSKRHGGVPNNFHEPGVDTEMGGFRSELSRTETRSLAQA